MLDDKAVARHNNLPQVFVAGFVSALLIGTAAFLVWRHVGTSGSEGPISPNIAAPSSDIAASADIISAPAEAVEPKTNAISRAVSSTDKAMAAARALRRGDDGAAALLAQRVLADSQLQAFGFAPFNRFINHLSQGDDPSYVAGLNQWIARDPRSALGYLLRAKYDYDTAWAIRGPDGAAAVTGIHMQAFEEELSNAEADVKKAIELDPGNPFSYFLWLNVAAWRDGGIRVEEVFREGIARFPSYYELYRARLSYLPRTREQIEFVSRYAGAVPDSSPLKLLYLQLQVSLPRHGGCRIISFVSLIDCLFQQISRPPTDALETGVAQAFALYKHSDPFEYSNALWPILENMESRSDFSSILQQAADALGSDNQLIHDPGHNNYALDDITARVWERLGNPVNVRQKYRDALDDVERMHFDRDEYRDEARATIYDHMAWTARRASQYTEVMTYHDAANEAAGINHGGSQYLKCFALLKLDRFRESIDECSELIATHRDVPEALYNRARAREGLKQYDAAIADFSPIAENGSENYIRWGAALEMEHVMALQGNYQGELEVFEKYPFMFDDRLQPAKDLAVAYNNRCFAYMKTGELKKALDDCNMSLRYGQLPDALHKRQELLKLLEEM